MKKWLLIKFIQLFLPQLRKLIQQQIQQIPNLESKIKLIRLLTLPL